MNRLTESEFLRWAEDRGLGPGPDYPRWVDLDFVPPSGDARFWCVPAAPERRPHFISQLLELIGDWQSCYAWRHAGSWPAMEETDRLNWGTRVERQILQGLGLPMGTADVVQFCHDDLDKLLTLIFSTTVFGWSVGEDLYVVPDHSRQILLVSHHAVVHVKVRDKAEVGYWAREMENRGFPLPRKVPDSTFQRPSWMAPDDP